MDDLKNVTEEVSSKANVTETRHEKIFNMLTMQFYIKGFDEFYKHSLT